MDRTLLELLACPATRQPLHVLDGQALKALNDAIGEGRVLRADGSLQRAPLAQALATPDRGLVYRVDDGIPVLLAEEALRPGPAPVPSA